MTVPRFLSLAAKVVVAVGALAGGALVVVRLERDRPRVLLERAGARIVEGPDGTPRTLSFPEGACRDEHLQQVARLDTLQRVFVRGGTLGPDGLRALQSLHELSALDLSSSVGAPGCLPELGQLPALRRLWLQNCGSWVGDDGLRHLQALRALEILDLSGTKVSDDGLIHLAQLPRLASLNLLRCSAVTDEGLRRLARFPSLQSVECTGAGITRAGARAFLRERPAMELRTESLDAPELQPLVDAGAGIKLDPRYEIVSIEWHGDRTRGWVNLPGGGMISRLDALDMPGPSSTTATPAHRAVPVEPAAVAVLADCRYLSTLNVRDVAIADAALAPLAQGSALRWVNLDNCPIRGEGLRYLHGHHDLQSLRLRSPNLTNDALLHLGQMTWLKSLEIEGCLDADETAPQSEVLVTDDGLRHLQGLVGLQMLSLAGLPLSGAGLEHLQSLPALSHLTLRLDRWDEESLRHVARLPKLAILTVAGPTTAHGVRRLPPAAALAGLRLEGMDLDEAATRELAALPNLRSLQLTHGSCSVGAIRAIAASSGLRSLQLYRTDCPEQEIEDLRRMRPDMHLSVE